jgi:ABC-type oligopeptide transport system ATPase subunit
VTVSDSSAQATDREVLVRAEGVRKLFPVRSAAIFRGERLFVHAVDGVDLEVRQGETLGLGRVP